MSPKSQTSGEKQTPAFSPLVFNISPFCYPLYRVNYTLSTVFIPVLFRTLFQGYIPGLIQGLIQSFILSFILSFIQSFIP